MINEAVARMQRDKAFEPGQLQYELANFPMRIDAVHVSQTLGRLYMLLAHEERRDREAKDLKVLQLVWPDQDGRYPDDIDYALPPQMQPLLSLPCLDSPEGSA